MFWALALKGHEEVQTLKTAALETLYNGKITLSTVSLSVDKKNIFLPHPLPMQNQSIF